MLAIYQHHSSGEYFTYYFYELNSDTHCLVGVDGSRLMVGTNTLNNEYNIIDFIGGY